MDYKDIILKLGFCERDQPSADTLQRKAHSLTQEVRGLAVESPPQLVWDCGSSSPKPIGVCPNNNNNNFKLE